MKNKKLLIVLNILAAAFFFTGCFAVDGEFKNIRNDVLNETKSKFTTDVEFSVGSFGIAVAGSIVKLSDDEEQVEEILENISHVQVGVYKNVYHNKLKADFNFLKTIDKKMKKNGWKFIVRSKEDDEITGIYVNEDSDVLFNKLFVISLNKEELTMVQVEGELEKVIETAIYDKKLALGMR